MLFPFIRSNTTLINSHASHVWSRNKKLHVQICCLVTTVEARVLRTLCSILYVAGTEISNIPWIFLKPSYALITTSCWSSFFPLWSFQRLLAVFPYVSVTWDEFIHHHCIPLSLLVHQYVSDQPPPFCHWLKWILSSIMMWIQVKRL